MREMNKRVTGTHKKRTHAKAMENNIGTKLI